MTAPTLEAERAAPTLAPCPFCGGKAELSKTRNMWMVECNNANCGSNPDSLALLKHDAISAWNRRTAAPVAEGVALPPKQSIGDDPKFQRLLGQALDREVDRYITSDRQDVKARFEEEKAALIAYIDGRTAAPAKSIETLVREVSAQLMGDVTERVGLPAEDGDDHGEQNYLTGKFAGITMFERSLLKLIDGRTAGTAWISVDDERKPEARKPILLFVRTLTRGEDDEGRPHETEGAEVAMGEYRRGASTQMSYFDCYTSPMSDNDWITHWMPLPAAPSPLPPLEETK